MAQKNCIVYVYNSFADPLFKGNLLLILKEVGKANTGITFHLITYEQENYRLTEAEKSKIKAELQPFHVVWYPLTWHSGSFKLLKKAYDLLLGGLLVLKLKYRQKARSITSLGTVSGSFAFIFSRLFSLKYYGYQYEPHSEFLRDFKIWSSNSIAYRGLNYLEYQAGMHGEILSTGTTHMIRRLQEWGSKAKAYKLPSCVDENKFVFRASGRERIRKQFNCQNKQVVLYLGKFGGIYYDQEIGVLFKTLQDLNPNIFFLVVSPDPKEQIEQMLLHQNVDRHNFAVTVSPFEEVPDYISAGDFGVVAVPSLPSQRFRSPIKVGEYLCCGLPYIVCQGVSEDDLCARNNQVGVVVETFTPAEIKRVYDQILAFLNEDKASLRARCRAAGVAYRGLQAYLPTAHQIFAEL